MILKKIKIWLLATRAETLLLSISPITIGSFLAYKDIPLNIPLLILTYLYGIFLHLGTNLCNDYYDFIKGADNENRIAPFSTIQLNLTSLRQIKCAYSMFFIIAFLIGLVFVYRGGILVLMLFTLPIFSGFFYTASSKALGYLGFGELLVFIFFGPFAVLGTYFLQTLKLSYLPILTGLVPGLFAIIILSINNLRDKELDQKANKKTSAVRFGKTFVQTEILLSAFLIFIIPWTFYFFINKTVIITSSFFIFFIPFKPIIKLTNLFSLNKAIQKTVILQTVYTLLFCAGLL